MDWHWAEGVDSDGMWVAVQCDCDQGDDHCHDIDEITWEPWDDWNPPLRIRGKTVEDIDTRGLT